MSIIIKGGTAVTENGAIKADIRIDGERIVEIAEHISPASGDETVDAARLIALPGVIDSHVHYHMKTAAGFTADDFGSGSACAVLAGTTTIVDFATPREGMSLADAMRARMAEADGECYTDRSFHMEVTGAYDIDLDELDEVKAMGIRGLKIYTTYGKSEFPPSRIPELFSKARELGLVTLVHAEDNDIVTRRKQEFLSSGKTQAKYHGESRPVSAETTSIAHILKLAREAGNRVIIAHISSGEGARMVAKERKTNPNIFGETCPHYLLLTDACYTMDMPQRFIMTPPLRKAEDNQALWEILEAGGIDKISTDHCSFTLEDKLKKEGCFEAIPGIGGSEALLPMMFDEGYSKGRLTLTELAARLSTNAAKLYGLYPRKGCIREGSDADIVLVDPNREVVFDHKLFPSKAGYSVFDGRSIKGFPVATYRRGELVAKDGKITGKKNGKFIPAK